MVNSPAGTGERFGWANAVISALIPVAALLVIRECPRTGGSVGYPMFLLVCAVSLAPSAQLAVAKPGPSGWLLSTVPALALLGLSKLVLAGAPTTTAAPSAPAVPATSVTAAALSMLPTPVVRAQPASIAQVAPASPMRSAAPAVSAAPTVPATPTAPAALAEHSAPARGNAGP
jgi:hypothetical protein